MPIHETTEENQQEVGENSSYEERQLEEIFDEKELLSYFQSAKSKTSGNALGRVQKRYTEWTIGQVGREIRTGMLPVKHVP